MTLGLLDILGILIIYQSLIFIFATFFNAKSKPFFTKVLLSIFIVITLHFGYMLLANQKVIGRLFLGAFFGILYGPIYFMYTKSLILERLNFKRDLLHFLPAILVLFIVVFSGERLIDYNSGISLIIGAHFVTYLGLSLRLIYAYRKELLQTTSSFYRISLFWLEIIIYIQLLTIILAASESILQTVLNTNVVIIAIYIFTLILTHCLYYLGLKQVRLFHGLKEVELMKTSSAEFKIPEKVYVKYVKELKEYMENEQPYLEYDITLNDIAKKLSITPRNLSYVINTEFNRNYYYFINDYRLAEAKTLLRDTDKTIKEVMYDSGFANKSTFFSIFKKATGKTPLQYRSDS